MRNRLSAAGIAVSDPVGGSRTTPTGSKLSWQSFLLDESSAEKPFFIVWSEQTAHPSTTSPSGCKLQQWSVASPHAKDLAQLRQALDLRVDVAEAKAPSMRLSLACPKGAVRFKRSVAAARRVSGCSAPSVSRRWEPPHGDDTSGVVIAAALLYARDGQQ